MHLLARPREQGIQDCSAVDLPSQGSRTLLLTFLTDLSVEVASSTRQLYVLKRAYKYLNQTRLTRLRYFRATQTS